MNIDNGDRLNTLYKSGKNAHGFALYCCGVNIDSERIELNHLATLIYASINKFGHNWFR